MLKLIIIILIFVPFHLLHARSALLITIDGLRPDAITDEAAPNLAELISGGSYTPKARTVYPSLTIPSHTSLLTGLDVKNHKVTFNKWEGGQDYLHLPTLFTILTLNKLSYSFICGKKKLLFLLPEPGTNTVQCYDVDEDKKDIENRISTYFLNDFKKNRPPMSFVHFPQPDREGHSHGWMSEPYNLSLKTVDREIGKIIRIFNGSHEQDTLVIITADHGGHEDTHGTMADTDILIPWIAFGKSVKSNYKIDRDVFIYDTTPTILDFLHIAIPNNIDGSTIREIFN